jgi:hypothetical protein
LLRLGCPCWQNIRAGDDHPQPSARSGSANDGFEIERVGEIANRVRLAGGRKTWETSPIEIR